MTEQGIVLHGDQPPFTARTRPDRMWAGHWHPLHECPDHTVHETSRPAGRRAASPTGTRLRVARGLVVRAAHAVGAATGRSRAVAGARGTRVAAAARRRARGPVTPKPPATLCAASGLVDEAPTVAVPR